MASISSPDALRSRTAAKATGHSAAPANGKSPAAASGKGLTWAITEEGRKRDIANDTHSTWEFGGPPGVTAMMIGFPLLMYYLWICLWFNGGKFVYPTSVDDIKPFFQRMASHVYNDAYPSAKAFAIYEGLMAFQLVLAFTMPGLKIYGQPVPSLNYQRLPYECNALASFYVTMITAAALHISGIFNLATIIDYYGELLTVAMGTAIICTFVIYFAAVWFNFGGKPIRMSNYFVYDLFMGASLNPRLGSIDLKMWAEVRIPWVLLFMFSISAALKQYQDIGYVTPNMAFMVLATGLYINACAKGEECIPVSMDMTNEKFGFMLIFWNLAGVPFTYCYSILYLHKTDPALYTFSTPIYVFLFALLLTSYYIFDTANGQKAAFRMRLQGDYKPRNAFPALPWTDLKDPKYIETKHGNKLLISGWWKYAVKPHYSADWVQSLSWGLITGFSTPIAYYYPAWFITVLLHRCGRDFERCEKKYGDDWKRYREVVKWKYIPGVY